MSDVRLSEIVEGYVEVAKHYTDAATAVVAGAAAAVEAGTFTADDATATAAKLATLAWEGWFALVMEGLDAVAVYSSDQVIDIDAGPFQAPVAGGTRVLAITANFATGFGDQIAATALQPVPNKLPPGNNEFRVRGRIGVCPSGVYRGKVQVTNDQGAATAVDVAVVV